MTQRELADKLLISSQAVSRWENGDALPEISLLLELSQQLGVSVDMILKAGCPNDNIDKREKFNVLDVPKGFEAMKSVKDYFGEKSLFYIGMIQGVGKIMNFDFEEALEKNLRILYLEVIISAVHSGYYVEKREPRADVSAAEDKALNVGRVSFAVEANAEHDRGNGHSRQHHRFS